MVMSALLEGLMVVGKSHVSIHLNMVAVLDLVTRSSHIKITHKMRELGPCFRSDTYA